MPKLVESRLMQAGAVILPPLGVFLERVSTMAPRHLGRPQNLTTDYRVATPTSGST